MFDFVLEEARVFLQGLSELRNTLVDLQQLHRVAVVIPRWCYVLEKHTKNVKSEQINFSVHKISFPRHVCMLDSYRIIQRTEFVLSVHEILCFCLCSNTWRSLNTCSVLVVSDKHEQWTHRGQRQTEVGGLVLHLDLDLVEESLDSFLLEAVSVNDDEEEWGVQM